MRKYRLKFNQIAITELASNSKFSCFFHFSEKLIYFLTGLYLLNVKDQELALGALFHLWWQLVPHFGDLTLYALTHPNTYNLL